MGQVSRIVNETTEVDGMVSCKVSNLMKRPNLLPFVWRIRKTMSKIEDVHFQYQSTPESTRPDAVAAEEERARGSKEATRDGPARDLHSVDVETQHGPTLS